MSCILFGASISPDARRENRFQNRSRHPEAIFCGRARIRCIRRCPYSTLWWWGVLSTTFRLFARGGNAYILRLLGPRRNLPSARRREAGLSSRGQRIAPGQPLMQEANAGVLFHTV